MLLTECCQGDQIREAEMGWACGMYETQEVLEAKKPSDPDVESRVALKHNLIGITAWTALVWLRMGSGLL